MLRTNSLQRCLLFVFCLTAAWSQQIGPAQSAASDSQQPLTPRERLLLERIADLEQRVAALEKKVDGSAEAAASARLENLVQKGATQQNPVSSSIDPPAVGSSATQTNAAPAASSPPLTFAGGTTLNFLVDTYYDYNFNQPIGRVNLLRAYDVLSNAFSLNQAAFVVDSPPDTASGKPYGLRLDLQFGQATQTLQGNPANEPRPSIYRNVFQAYGTYVVPIGKGLTVDFGKFASSLGMEGNYTQDQMNYSRAYWFNYLPFYHMGIRTKYKFNDKFTLNYWLVNGEQQTEPFKGFKDQFFGLALQPAKTLSWNINYYFGQDHPNTQYFPNGGAPADAPTVQGVPFEPIPDAPEGKVHIFDTYLTWNATPKLTVAGEADYVIQRLYTFSSPQHTDGGAGYLQYQFTPKLSMAARAEYLSDRGALFSGLNQALKETTLTAKYNAAQGLDIFAEWRRDFSNQPYFYTNELGVLSTQQNTATIGLVWWLGGKQGSW